jgi:predicted RNase H-like HicB family nuclease
MNTETLEDLRENIKLAADAWVDLYETIREELEKRMGPK